MKRIRWSENADGSGFSLDAFSLTYKVRLSLRDGTRMKRIRWSKNTDGTGFSLENLLSYI
jgi:hypothetical protein